ncbi:MAG TPA: hypothetical protein VK217_12075 [Acidimicrobiales bacterium]|nr:hypothetical protein [Acidimicrobiales bacterium]
MTLRRSLSQRSSGNGTDKGSRRGLVSEKEFLRQSIEDLERELASGDVDAADFAILQARYSGRLAEVEAAIAELATAPRAGSDEETDVAARWLDNAPARQAASARPAATTRPAASTRQAASVRPVSSVPFGRRLRRRLGSRRGRLVIGIGATACFVVAATLLAASLAGVRLPGESASGSVSLSSTQQEQETLDRAAILGSEGQVAEAVQLYDEVLQTDPDQPDALAYGGWLIRLAGLSAKNRLVSARGDASVARAVKVAPSYPDGHALLGVILYEDFGNPKAASVQFLDALRVGASKNLLESVAAIAAKAFAAAKETLPPRYAAALRSAKVAAG